MENSPVACSWYLVVASSVSSAILPVRVAVLPDTWWIRRSRTTAGARKCRALPFGPDIALVAARHRSSTASCPEGARRRSMVRRTMRGGAGTEAVERASPGPARAGPVPQPRSPPASPRAARALAPQPPSPPFCACRSLSQGPRPGPPPPAVASCPVSQSPSVAPRARLWLWSRVPQMYRKPPRAVGFLLWLIVG